MGVYLNNFLDCGLCEFAVPAFDNEQECTSYSRIDSQISDLVIVPIQAPDPFDWTGANPVYVADTINNTVSSLDYARRLVGEGEVLAAESSLVLLPRNRQLVSRRAYTLVFRVKNLEGNQYEFCKRFQGGWKMFRFYFLTVGGKLIGPVGGLLPSFVDCDFPLDPTRGGKEYAEIAIRYEADGDADRASAALSDPAGAELEEWEECETCEFCFPPIQNEQDCTTYPQRDSQVCEVVMVPLTAPDPFTWTTGAPVYVNDGIDNTEILMAKAKRLVGEGGVDVPQKSVSTLPRNRQSVERRLYTLTLRIYNTGGNMFALIRHFQCHWKLFRFYFLTVGGRMFGPAGGIKPLFTDATMPLEGGRGSKEYFDLILQWEGMTETVRWSFALADDDISVPPVPIDPPEVIGDDDTGEGWGDETTGEVWGWTT